MPETSCPTADTLHAFALGTLREAEWAPLADHVQSCPRCQEQLEAIDTTFSACDPLLGRLQQIPSTDFPEDDRGSRWASAVMAAMLRTASTAPRLTADAGRDLAHRLAGGPVCLGRFELLAELGVGSFGYVFKACDPQLDRVVALKVQRAGSFASEEDIQRFLREARSAAQLKHPSIVSLYETGQTEEGVCYLVCEFIDGATLEHRLQDGPLDPATAADFAAELADALQYAHEHGVIHRDIKPSNVIVDERGRAHLMDFGLAKRETGEATMTSDGRVMGTPAYMSPEQARGTSHEVDARSDLYSLGVVLYEMLTGERPFQGNRRLLLLQVLEDDPRPLRRLKPDLPRDLEVICLKAMHKSPARRYQTAQELADDLRRYRKRQAILARPIGYVERSLRWCRRYPLAVSLFVAVMLGSIAGIWHLSSLSEYFVRQTALESSRMETKMFDEVWRFYSEEIADIDPTASGVSITENYRTVHPALPLPASFAIDLGERIGRRNPGMEVRVYSRYPWPDRRDGGPQDVYEEAALARLEATAHPNSQPPAEYVRFVSEGDQRKLLYFSARHMEQSCLGCHNHPDGRSPKKDWQVGDVVGVLKIVRPLDREIDNTRRGLRGAFVLMGTVAGFLLVLSAVVMILAERRRMGATP